MRRFHRLAAGVLLGLAPSSAWAQAVPDLRDLVTQSEQINRGASQAARARTVRDGTGEAIDGEAGIYVLTVNEIFQVSAAAGLGYSDNPARTADDLGGSMFGDFSLSAGLATRLGETVDFGLSANVAGREYFEEDAPSSRTLSASMSAGLPVAGPLYAGVGAFAGYSFDGGFKNGTAFYGLTANLSAAVPLTSRLVVRPGIGATRQWAEVSENDSTLVAASVDLVYAFAPRLTGSLRGSAVRRWYDDFYEDVTFVVRRDMLYGVTAALAWQPSANVVVATTLSYETQNSRFFLAKFDAFESSAGLSLRLRF